MNTIKLREFQAITTAPKRYDHGCTRVVCENIGTIKHSIRETEGKVLRLIESDSQYRLDYQMGENGSGNFFTTYDQERIDREITEGYLLVNPNPIFHIRKTYRFYLPVDSGNFDYYEYRDTIRPFMDISNAINGGRSDLMQESTNIDNNYYRILLDLPSNVQEEFMLKMAKYLAPEND